MFYFRIIKVPKLITITFTKNLKCIHNIVYIDFNIQYIRSAIPKSSGVEFLRFSKRQMSQAICFLVKFSGWKLSTFLKFEHIRL